MNVNYGNKAPFGYAPAYYDPCNDHTVCYLFPFNLIVRYSREAWYSINSINPGYRRKHPMYRQGYEDGKDDRVI